MLNARCHPSPGPWVRGASMRKLAVPGLFDDYTVAPGIFDELFEVAVCCEPVE